ncbi:MAG: phospholipase D-like domain-containing protein [Candidatus Acetothermia bacterium]|jgi:phosphatidylserine/phosphatidylglycerophosphate/cardiolipin synthase-like enzyme|nr:phospholipase D-like domain-containing protein [Candidatus Acetothermia bacterium]MDH7505206.1 phosphatidylserine/phosphatidylglycerophosphate/cardiolipin synthase family protein [Candidatus Acetothermia bacterium]
MKGWRGWLLPLILALLVLAGAACQRTTPGLGEQLLAYFNDPLAGLPRLDRPQAQAGELKGRLLELLARAERKLDAAVYSVTDPEVIAALEGACARGVRLRILTEAEEYQGQLGGLSCAQVRLDGNDRLMHDKFMVVDEELVWTGSANWTEGSFYYDANNDLVIRDREVARAYIQEFEEMFRSGRFGPAKRDDTPEEFEVAGLPVEVYFGPSDRPRLALLRLIGQAREELELAMFYYTDEALHWALVAALARGVKVRAVFDSRGFENLAVSRMDELLALGAGLLEALPGLVHHKFAVIDREIVITGSANWTASGLDHNDEDLVVIHSPELAARYAGEFERLYQDALAYDRDPLSPPRVTLKHYNTQDVPARVEWRPHLERKPDSYEICRATSPYGPCEQTFQVSGDHWYFADEAALPGRTYYYWLRSIVGGEVSDWSNEYAVTAGLPACPASGASWECDCDDHADNNGNGYIDCQDYDCAAATACIEPEWPKLELVELVPGTLSAEEAERDLKRYLGKVVTVRFYVVSTYDSGRVIYLDSAGDYKRNFTAVIFKRDEPNFLERGIRPELDYDRKLIEVTGELGEYNGPEIILRVPEQVRVLD